MVTHKVTRYQAFDGPNDVNKDILYSVAGCDEFPLASVILNVICSITSALRTGCVFCTQEV